MIRSRKYGEWYKKFIWYPMFFSHGSYSYFVWFDYVEHRQTVNFIGSVESQYRPVQTNEDQPV